MDQMLTRRTVLGTAGATLAAGAFPEAAGAAAAPLQPISMALHIHAPFSEGGASFSAHLAQARKHKVDVIWWTDHDFRIAAFEHRRAVHFDAAVEPEDGHDWTWTKSSEGAVDTSTAAFVASPHSPQDGAGKALRLAATGSGILWHSGKAWNSIANACIADTELTLDVLPEKVPKDGVLLMDVRLSHHPAKGGRAAGTLHLRYQIGLFGKVGHRADGTVGTVSLPVKAGVWQRFTFVLLDDVARLWPELVAGDNALTGLQIGVQRAGFVVDRLTFKRGRRAGRAGEQMPSLRAHTGAAEIR